MIDLKTSTNQDARIFLKKVKRENFENWCTLHFNIRENYAMDENGVVLK
jgi:hypothetical protein